MFFPFPQPEMPLKMQIFPRTSISQLKRVHFYTNNWKFTLLQNRVTTNKTEKQSKDALVKLINTKCTLLNWHNWTAKNYSMRSGLVWSDSGLVRLWSGLVQLWSGPTLVWSGLVRLWSDSGLTVVWSGLTLVWFGLVWSDCGLTVVWSDSGLVLLWSGLVWSGLSDQTDQTWYWHVWSTRQMVTELLNMRNGQSPVSVCQSVSQWVSQSRWSVQEMLAHLKTRSSEMNVAPWFWSIERFRAFP